MPGILTIVIPAAVVIAVTDTIRQLVESIATPIKGDATLPSTSDSDAE